MNQDLWPMTDPWCCYIWCSMDSINIPPMLAYIPAPWIRHGYYKLNDGGPTSGDFPLRSIDFSQLPASMAVGKSLAPASRYRATENWNIGISPTSWRWESRLIGIDRSAGKNQHEKRWYVRYYLPLVCITCCSWIFSFHVNIYGIYGYWWVVKHVKTHPNILFYDMSSCGFWDKKNTKTVAGFPHLVGTSRTWVLFDEPS